MAGNADNNYQAMGSHELAEELVRIGQKTIVKRYLDEGIGAADVEREALEIMAIIAERQIEREKDRNGKQARRLRRARRALRHWPNIDFEDFN